MDQFKRTTWRKGSASGSVDCVEVAITEQAVGVRDSKRRDDELLVFDHRNWILHRRGQGRPVQPAVLSSCLVSQQLGGVLVNRRCARQGATRMRSHDPGRKPRSAAWSRTPLGLAYGSVEYLYLVLALSRSFRVLRC